MAEKDVLFTVDEDLWQKAKIQAVTENISLRDFVSRAIQNELNRIANKQV